MASTRRQSPSGRSASPLPIAGLAPPLPSRPFCRLSRKPSSSRFASTRCCHSTTACTPCRPRSRSSPARRFIVAWNAMASAACPRDVSKAPTLPMGANILNHENLGTPNRALSAGIFFGKAQTLAAGFYASPTATFRCRRPLIFGYTISSSLLG